MTLFNALSLIILIILLFIIIRKVVIFRDLILEYPRMAFISSRIPGPKSLPFLGNAFLFLEHNYGKKYLFITDYDPIAEIYPCKYSSFIDMASIFKTLFIDYGEIFKIWIGTRLYVILSSSNAIQVNLKFKY